MLNPFKTIDRLSERAFRPVEVAVQFAWSEFKERPFLTPAVAMGGFMALKGFFDYKEGQESNQRQLEMAEAWAQLQAENSQVDGQKVE